MTTAYDSYLLNGSEYENRWGLPFGIDPCQVGELPGYKEEPSVLIDCYFSLDLNCPKNHAQSYKEMAIDRQKMFYPYTIDTILLVKELTGVDMEVVFDPDDLPFD